MMQNQPTSEVEKTTSGHNILLCVTGKSPAIVTETLWCLTQGHNADSVKHPIDEIHVITTLGGRDALRETLFENGSFEKMKDEYPDLANVRFDLDGCVHILIDDKTNKPQRWDPEEIRLADVRTGDENECAANQIYGILKDLIENSTRLHASAAGGRKTMSIYLTVMMQLLARADDTLSHIIVWDDFESDRSFLYPSREMVANSGNLPIALAFVPFIRLKEITKPLVDPITKSNYSYTEAVSIIRERLRRGESNSSLLVDPKRLRVSFDNESVTLSSKRMFVLLIYAISFERSGEAFLADEEISPALVERAFRRLTATHGTEHSLATFESDFNRSGLLEPAAICARRIEKDLQSVRSGKITPQKFAKYMRDSRTDLNKSLKKLHPKAIVGRDGEIGDSRFGFAVDVLIKD